jgi:hypothetical protein
MASKYQDRWWYVERPFPWLACAAVAVPVAIITFAVVLGIFWWR